GLEGSRPAGAARAPRQPRQTNERPAHPGGEKGLVMILGHGCARSIWRRCSATVLASLCCAGVHAQESWDAVYLAGAKIGHVHTFVEKVQKRGRDYHRVRIDIEQRLKRRNDVAVIKLMYGTIETPDGQVLRLDTRTVAAGQDLRAHGDVINGEMKLILE